MTTTPLPPAIEPVAWFEYARKKPTLKRLVFDRTSRSQLRVAGWVSEPLIKESDAQQARADLEAENKRLLGTIDAIYIYANDTLSGRTDGPDDREWQRAAVAEIRNRARKHATVDSAVFARADLEADVARLREALNDAATSLETIQLRSYGEDSGLSTLLEVRGYAGNRAKVARAALKGSNHD